MSITVRHTPYEAVGELAKRGGEAIQATREQDYSFRAATQARQINASLQLQRERVSAEMDMQGERMEQQKVQFDQNLELQTAQVSARESATHYQYLNNQKQMQQQAEQFEEQMQYKEQAFKMESAMADRRLNLAEQTGELAVERFHADMDVRQQNTQMWQSLEGTIDPDTYTNGLLAIQSGRMPQLPDPQVAKMETENQKYRRDMTMQQMKLKQQQYEAKIAKEPLDEISAKKAQEYAKAVVDTLPGIRRFDLHAGDREFVYKMYSTYAKLTNYGSLGQQQKADVDAIFNTEIQDAGGEVAWRDLQSIKDQYQRFGPLPSQTMGSPTSGQPTTADSTAAQSSFEYQQPLPQGGGNQITDDAVKIFTAEAVKRAGTKTEAAALARQMARDNGWKL